MDTVPEAFRAQQGKGRPKGALNKSTRLAKDAIAEAAEALGGTERLVAWCKEDDANERVFWGSIYPKLLPLQITGDKDNPLHIISKENRDAAVAAASRADQ